MIYYITGQTVLENSCLPEDMQLASLQDCLDYFKDKLVIQVDTETEFCKWNGNRLPDPYTSNVLCIQLGDNLNQFVIDKNTIDITPLFPLFENESIVKIFCNAFFDLRFFHHWKVNIKNVYDIFLVECILNRGKILPEGFRSLENMALRYADIQLNKDIRGQIHWRGLDVQVIRYAAEDVAYMEIIQDAQLLELKKHELSVYALWENRYVIDLSRMSYHGFKVNSNSWHKVKLENESKLRKLYDDLEQFVINDPTLARYVDYTLFGNNCKINWRSSKQVIPFLNSIGVETLFRDKKTGIMKDTVDIKQLKKQKHKHSILKIYIEYKEIEKEISTYGEKFLIENLNQVTRRIHSEFFQILDTGRISSNKPNLQNIPASDNEGNPHPLRKCFEADKNNVLIVADYSQQEPRVTADYSQDPYLIDFILNGDGDSHSLISTMISEYLLGEHQVINKKNNPIVPKYGKKIRDIGKMINLGKDYGKTAFSIKDDLGITQEEAQKLLDIIDATTPEKIKYFKQWQNFVEQNGYVITDNVIGSKTWFPYYNEYLSVKAIPEGLRKKEERSKFYKLKGQMDRFAQNNRIQGTSALITKLAHISINNTFDSKQFEFKPIIVNCVHDEIVVECNEKDKDLVAKIMQSCMEEAGSYFCKTIPMIAEPEINKQWIK